MAGERSSLMCKVDPPGAQVIRVDALWLSVEPMDMRAGTDTALGRVVALSL